MGRIIFGTSGWRGILCEEFTYANLRRVIRAIADHAIASGEGDKGFFVGYDPQFMGWKFAEESARIIDGAGIQAFLCDRDTPTPVISPAILTRGFAGAVNFTASHNPFDYNGIKFTPTRGGPALPETTPISRGGRTPLPDDFSGNAVLEVITIDGTKCLLRDGSWLLFRKSGSEPVVRLYGEASLAGC